MTAPCLPARALLLAFACAPGLAGAQDGASATAWSPYIVVSGEADDANSSRAMIELGSSIGTSGWLLGGVGRSTLTDTQEDIDTKLFKLGGGVSIAAIDLAANLTHRADGDAFRQQDLGFELTWQFSRGSIGTDVFIRSAEAETVFSVQRRRLNPRAVRITESIDGTGYGLHGDFDVTPALTAFASWMTYDYDIETNRPLLARFSLLNGSGVTRSEAFLDRSFEAGLAYQFKHATLTTQYMRDASLVENDVTDTLQLSVMILLGDHWSLTPLAGLSDTELRGHTAFGGLSVGYSF